MKTQIFVIYDSKANAYMQPWFLTTIPMAIRAFQDCIADPKHNFGAHPEDYTLFDIGQFDAQTAKINWTPPVSLGNGLEHITQNEQNAQPDFFETEEGPYKPQNQLGDEFEHTEMTYQSQKLTDGE